MALQPQSAWWDQLDIAYVAGIGGGPGGYVCALRWVMRDARDTISGVFERVRGRT